MVSLQGLPPIWKTFITTINTNNELPTFDALVRKITKKETLTISRGRIQHHEEGEPYVFVSQGKKRKGKRGPPNTNNISLTFKDSNGAS